jgi:hypothetical protein
MPRAVTAGNSDDAFGVGRHDARRGPAVDSRLSGRARSEVEERALAARPFRRFAIEVLGRTFVARPGANSR